MQTTQTRLATIEEWALDPTHTSVEFSVRHMMITNVKGRFGAVAGTVQLGERPEDSRVRVEIDAASIDTGVEERDAHLRSAEFLDVEAHPKLTFESTGVRGEVAEGSEFEVTGLLTIRGVTREVVVRARLEGRGRDPWGGERIAFSGETKIDREEFGLTWNQALETGGILVGRELRITIEAQAVRAD